MLYPSDRSDNVMAITIAVKIAKYYGSPTIHPLRENQTQTERTELRTKQTQVSNLIFLLEWSLQSEVMEENRVQLFLGRKVSKQKSFSSA